MSAIINTNYIAVNAHTDKTAEFKFSDHMGARKVFDKETGEERSITIRDVAEEAMLSKHGIDKIHGWSVPAREDYWELRAKDKTRRPFETVLVYE
jgi:hypothetical protein